MSSARLLPVLFLGLFGIVAAASGQAIEFSVAIPVVNETVTITVPGLEAGGLVTVTDSRAVVQQLSVDASGRVSWQPPRCGKHSVASAGVTETIWVTARPMTFHWWDAALAQRNVTSVMSSDPAWKPRGVTAVKWVGGEAYARGVDGHSWTEAAEWFDHWTQGSPAEGVAIDEAFFDSGFPSDPIVEAISLLRAARGPDYSVFLWSMGFGAGFAEQSISLRDDGVQVLIEDYSGDWDTHLSKWAYARAYGLEDQTVFGIWPGNAPLSSPAAVRADLALLRLAAPEAKGIAIFAPAESLLPAIDAAIEDYFLKPILYLSNPTNGNLGVWNLGNDEAVGFLIEFLDGAGSLLQSQDLSNLAANEQRELTVPSQAVHARIIHPAATANLYENNSRFPNAWFPVGVPGRYVWNNSQGNHEWVTPGNWAPQGPPPGNLDSDNFACFDGGIVVPATVLAKSGETSIEEVHFIDAGWRIAGDPVTQNFYTYSIRSEGVGTNVIDIGISARDVVPALFRVGTGNTLVINGRVGAARNSGGVRKFGLGELILNEVNSYLGDTVIRGGTITVGGTGLLGQGSYAAELTIHNGCTFQYRSSAEQRLTGEVGGNGDLLKNGPGVLILEGDNPLSGSVSVQAGELILKGALPQARVEVGPAALLGGTGTFGKSVLVSGTLSPGLRGTGNLSAENVILSGRFLCEVDGGQTDKLSLSGKLDLTGSSLEVSPIGSGFTAGPYPIATYASLSGRFSSVTEGYVVRYEEGVNGNEIWLERSVSYLAWAALHAGGEAMELDHDQNGIANGVEYFMGSGVFPDVAGDPEKELRWPKRSFYAGVYGTDYWLEKTTDFSSWTRVPVDDPQLRDEDSLRYVIPPGVSRLFLRLRVTGP